jgi:hypothetical protein
VLVFSENVRSEDAVGLGLCLCCLEAHQVCDPTTCLSTCSVSFLIGVHPLYGVTITKGHSESNLALVRKSLPQHPSYYCHSTRSLPQHPSGDQHFQTRSPRPSVLCDSGNRIQIQLLI